MPMHFKRNRWDFDPSNKIITLNDLRDDDEVRAALPISGRTILSGVGPPEAGTGLVDDFYIDLAAYEIYGPKGFSAWPNEPYSLKGEPGSNGSNGSDGEDGQNGQSAYQLWLAAGNSGTVVDFLTSLKGAPGSPGNPGGDGVDATITVLETTTLPPGDQARVVDTGDGSSALLTFEIPAGWPGRDGYDGDDGQSAYQLWLTLGHSGTESDFLASLKGADGNDGLDGKSAYEVWLAAGHSGTEADFLASLKGNPGVDGDDGLDGQNGQSAYQLWLAQGNAGTEMDFLASLEGSDGENGTDGADATVEIPRKVVTASYTLLPGDAGGRVEVDSATPCSITVTTMPAGTPLQVCQAGAGAVTLIQDAGIVLRPTSSLVTRTRWSSLLLYWRTATEVVVEGDAQ